MEFMGTDATKSAKNTAYSDKFVRTTTELSLKPIPIQELKGFERNQKGYREMLHEKKK